MKRKNILYLILGAVVVIGLTVMMVILLRSKANPQSGTAESGGTTVSILSEEEVSAMASDILAETSFDPTFSYGDSDPVYFGFSYPHPCSTLEEGEALSLEQIDENIVDLQTKYLEYLKTCPSEELKNMAQTTYDAGMKWLRYVRNVKTRTSDQEQELHETAFYKMYDEIVSACENPEKRGWSPEYAQEQLDIAERAKKYYEDGTITIDQACQAIGLGSPSLSYDSTFSLPE